MKAPYSALPTSTDRLPRVVIDRGALMANWRMLAARVPGGCTGAAVKADGYGLGAAAVGGALHAVGCRDFFVAWPQEGAAFREAMGDRGCRIFVLQGLDPSSAEHCIRDELIPVLSTGEDVAIWMATSGRESSPPCVLQFETGMNRLGLDAEAVREAAEHARAGRLRLAAVMSHLASADDPASSQNAAQLQRFSELSSLFPGVPRSLANSAGIFLGEAYHFDLARPGIALYGGHAGPASEGSIRPVATLLATILQLRTARAGEAAGYGAAARLQRDTKIATIGLGYADGFPRAASGAGVPRRDGLPPPEIFLSGHRAPILGRVSMDLTLVDVTDLPEGAARPGDTVEVFGANISIDEVATRAGTIAYELLARLGPRVRRVWV